MTGWNTSTGKPDEQADEVRDLFQHLIKQEEQREATGTVVPPAGEPVSPSTPTFEPIAEGPEETTGRTVGGVLPDYTDIPLILPLPFDEDDEYEETDWTEAEYAEEDLPTPPTERRNPLKVFWDGFCANLPRKGDCGKELVRKLAFLLALVVLISSVGYILYDMVLQPAANSSMYGNLLGDYQPDDDQPVTGGNYPEGMLGAFRSLYDQNPEVRGWLTYEATSERDFLKINYPVMYSGDNDKYLTIDFYQKKNKNGVLFFDMRNTIEPDDYQNKVLIIYGHNMASGQMFAGLNKFIGNVNNARAAATMTLSTLFERDQYKVFAVVMTDEDATGRDYFNTRRTQFGTDGDFLGYIDEVRARSLFDYPVDVIADDQLLVLSTCTAPSTAKVKDGRLVVFARKVRSGETNDVDLASIVKNEDVIMPRAWYEKQNMQPHPFYTDGNYVIDETVTTTTWTGIPDIFGGTDATGTSDTDATGTTDATGSGTGDSTTTGSGAVTPGGSTTTAGGTSGGTTAATGGASGGATTAATGAQTPPATTQTDAAPTDTTQAAGETTTEAPAADTTAATTEAADTTEAGTDTTEAANS